MEALRIVEARYLIWKSMANNINQVEEQMEEIVIEDEIFIKSEELIKANYIAPWSGASNIILTLQGLLLIMAFPMLIMMFMQQEQGNRVKSDEVDQNEGDNIQNPEGPNYPVKKKGRGHVMNKRKIDVFTYRFRSRLVVFPQGLEELLILRMSTLQKFCGLGDEADDDVLSSPDSSSDK
ncbi:hypothetical protein KY285_030286 [Solanum tuberosum]|nr:hypothetical protein KY285_030286 [Solanum tuberosum]